MIIAGIGCRRNTPLAAIIAAIDAAFLRAGRARNDLRAIATAVMKRDETGKLLIRTSVRKTSMTTISHRSSKDFRWIHSKAIAMMLNNAMMVAV